ncbi:hypothetical protein Tco_0718706 [Tanacetum coccineum]
MDSRLSLEMIIEILSRALSKTLDTMLCANKELDTLTRDGYVLDLYKKRNNIVYGFLLRSMEDHKNIKRFAPSPNTSNLDLGFLHKDDRILATSEQGIIASLVFAESQNKLHDEQGYNCHIGFTAIIALQDS